MTPDPQICGLRIGTKIHCLQRVFVVGVDISFNVGLTRSLVTYRVLQQGLKNRRCWITLISNMRVLWFLPSHERDLIRPKKFDVTILCLCFTDKGV